MKWRRYSSSMFFKTSPNRSVFLAALSAWAVDHNSPRLFISVPNAAHFDRGIGLLLGDWPLRGPASGGMSSNFTKATLERTLEQCGWLRIDEENVLAVRSEEWDEETFNGIPEELVGALRVLSETYNPYSAVERFVWALSPTRVREPLESISISLDQDVDDSKSILDRAAGACSAVSQLHWTGCQRN